MNGIFNKIVATSLLQAVSQRYFSVGSKLTVSTGCIESSCFFLLTNQSPLQVMLQHYISPQVFGLVLLDTPSPSPNPRVVWLTPGTKIFLHH